MTEIPARGVRQWACALCALVLAACAGHPVLEDGTGLPRAARADAVPFEGQRDHQCGPASMAMVLQASGVETGTDELTPKIFLPGRQGSVQPEMHAVARRYGRVPYPVEGGMEALLAEVAAGHPVVVLQNLALPFWPMWHYAVVTGYDLDRGVARMHTGETADASVGLRRLEATWARSGHWAMVVLPPDTLPARIDLDTALVAVHDFERVAGPAAAVHGWQAVTARWPASELAWFARGNAHQARDEADAAIHAYTTATELDPALAPAWINLGTLHIARGEWRTGVDALRTAAAIDGPWQRTARQALQDALSDTRDF